MKPIVRPWFVVLVLGLIGCVDQALAADLTVHLPDTASVSHDVVKYQCDAAGAKMGLPAGPFSAEYINGGGNSLVVVPVSGKSLIFANVSAASGARYAAQQYLWWEAGGAVTFSSDSMAGKMSSTCQRAKNES